MVDTEETSRWNGSRTAYKSINLGKNENSRETYSYRLYYYYYQQDSVNAHIVQAMFKIRIHSISGRSSSQGYSFKSPLLHHIVRMHILTHPPVSSCTSDLFPFPYPQANTTTRCLQEVLSATSPPSWDSTLMIRNSTEDLEFWLEVLAQVHDGSDVSAAVAVVGC